MIMNFKSYDLAIELFRKSSTLKMHYSLKDQLIRSSSSVVLNLAEGTHRLTPRDRRKFFNIAYSSLRETEAILTLVVPNNSELLSLVSHVGACIYNLIRHYNKKLNISPS